MKSAFISIVLGVIVGLFYVSLRLNITVYEVESKLDSLSLVVKQSHCLHYSFEYKEIIDSSLYYFNTHSFGVKGYYKICNLCDKYIDVITLHQYIKLQKEY